MIGLALHGKVRVCTPWTTVTSGGSKRVGVDWDEKASSSGRCGYSAVKPPDLASIDMTKAIASDRRCGYSKSS